MVLEDWGYVATYNQPGSIDGIKENYRVQITVPYQSFMNSDFSDIRFVASDNTTLLSYNLVTYTVNTSAIFDVKIPSLPASPSTYQLYIYADNPSATDASNSTLTYLTYDDATSDKASDYTLIDVYSTGINATFTYDSINKDYSLSLTQNDEAFAKINSLTGIENLHLESQIMRTTNRGNQQGGLIIRESASDTYIIIRYLTRVAYCLEIAQSKAGTITTLAQESYSLIQNKWYKISVDLIGTDLIVKWYDSSNVLLYTQNVALDDSFVGGSFGLNSGYDYGASNAFKNIKAYEITRNEPEEGTLNSWEVAYPPVADFTANITQGSGPLTVNFTNVSTNNPTSWNWNFGDGENSFEENPTHIYSDVGIYTVTLTVTKETATDTKTKTNYIAVTNLGSTLFCDNVTTTFHETISLNATLIDSSGTPISNEILTFTIAGIQYTATTNTFGIATINYTILDTINVGRNQYLVSFAGVDPHPATSATGIITVERLKPKITSQNYTGDIGETIQLKATLLDDDGVPMVGKTVNFYIPTISKTPVASATTNSSGIAEVSYIIPKI